MVIYDGDSIEVRKGSVRPSSESGPFYAINKCKKHSEVDDEKRARFSGEFNRGEYTMLMVRGKSAASVGQELADMTLYYEGIRGNKERLERFLREDIALLKSQLEIYQKNSHLVEKPLVESVPKYSLELNELEAKIKRAISKLSGPIEHVDPGRKVARPRIYGLENNLNSEEDD